MGTKTSDPNSVVLKLYGKRPDLMFCFKYIDANYAYITLRGEMN